jgi:DNA-binding IclR family transcriptional regulator
MARPRRELSLVKVFLAPRILTIEELSRRLDASRSTVLRRLNEHGYYSSYNHSGRFLTIAEVTEFDSRGLWTFKTARFSRHGNLKETIAHFVSSSEAGLNHQELAALLAVRVHNSLLHLVEDGRVARQQIGGSYVYLSPKARTQKQQAKRRIALVKEAEKPRVTSRQIIATLLELIRDSEATPAEIAARCQKAGMSISRELVEVIFARYDLGKKRAP